jgi:hypothetical protein
VADSDTNTLLELYKSAVEMADRVSSRRAGANTFFLTLNTALAAVVGIVSSARKPPPHGSAPSFDAFGLVLTAIAGIVLAIAWRALLAYYRRLNAAKFDVINKLERQLPAQPYADEWAILHPGEPSVPAATGIQAPAPLAAQDKAPRGDSHRAGRAARVRDDLPGACRASAG